MHRTLDVITVVLAALGLLALAVLAVRGMREPAIAAQAFGVPAGDGGGAFGPSLGLSQAPDGPAGLYPGHNARCAV